MARRDALLRLHQTLVARLCGLPVANASLYDGASATVEAVNLAVGSTGRQTVWVSGGLHPHWRAVLATFAVGTGHRLVDVPLVDGITDAGVSVNAAESGNSPAGHLNAILALPGDVCRIASVDGRPDRFECGESASYIPRRRSLVSSARPGSWSRSSRRN